MVIKNLWFKCNIKDNEKLYVIESNSNIDYPEYNGVNMIPLDAILSGRKYVDVRKISNVIWNRDNKKKFENIFKKVYW